MGLGVERPGEEVNQKTLGRDGAPGAAVPVHPLHSWRRGTGINGLVYSGPQIIGRGSTMERASRRMPRCASLLTDTVWRPPSHVWSDPQLPGSIAPLAWTIPGSLLPQPVQASPALLPPGVFMEHVVRAGPEAKPQGRGCGTSDGGCWARLLLYDSFASAGEAASYGLPGAQKTLGERNSPSSLQPCGESHEKERTRSREDPNWSLIGSVLRP